MTTNKLILTIIILFFVFLLTLPSYVSAGHFTVKETDTGEFSLVSFFDLRDRETYVQVTNTNTSLGGESFTPGSNVVVHVQIFNVDDDCNENNFYDTYTPHDTHVYNMRDIQTNDGNPSGVVLPEGAYGFVVASFVEGVGQSIQASKILIGNFRVIDDTGYEYRTNSLGINGARQNNIPDNRVYTVNFNQKGNVTLSDIVAIVLSGCSGSGCDPSSVVEWSVDVVEESIGFNVDILNNNEDIFSCRNVIFACTDQDNPRLEELLEFYATDDCCGGEAAANVASFEYGINEAIPHSRGSELLCPGNNISEGFVQLDYNQSINVAGRGIAAIIFVGGYVGLNNGNGRGSMDSWWARNRDAFE